MNYRMIAFILGRVLLILAALMLLPLVTALVYGESIWPFAATMEALRRDHDALLYSPALVGALAKDFEKLMPLCRFMAEATRGAAAPGGDKR